ncbi:MAG: helix-turn-helix domain-containing protein [Nitrosomonas sp.]
MARQHPRTQGCCASGWRRPTPAARSPRAASPRACSSARGAPQPGTAGPRLPNRAAPEAIAPISLDTRVRELEHTLIEWAMRASGGNQTRAAELLAIKRSTLQGRMARCRPPAEAGPHAMETALAGPE